MLKYLVDNPYKKDSTYEDWMSEGFGSYGMLWHIMEPHIATTVEFCHLYKKIWDFIARSFLHQSNVSCVNEKIFTTKQFGKWLSKYYNTLKKLMGSVIAVSIFYYWFGTTKASLGKLHDCFFAIWLRLTYVCSKIKSLLVRPYLPLLMSTSTIVLILGTKLHYHLLGVFCFSLQ